MCLVGPGIQVGVQTRDKASLMAVACNSEDATVIGLHIDRRRSSRAAGSRRSRDRRTRSRPPWSTQWPPCARRSRMGPGKTGSPNAVATAVGRRLGRVRERSQGSTREHPRGECGRLSDAQQPKGRSPRRPSPRRKEPLD